MEIPLIGIFYGGRAFFVPYLLALFFIGIPYLFLEIGLGQFYQTGEVIIYQAMMACTSYKFLKYSFVHKCVNYGNVYDTSEGNLPSLTS